MEERSNDEMQLCLKWNNFGFTVTSAFHSLHVGGELVDVTLAAEGQQFPAHRLVLAACSPYFREILKRNPCEHPIIILREVGAVELRRVLLFMYQGQVNVPQSCLPDFIRLAEALQVKGLTDMAAYTNNMQDRGDNGQQTPSRPTNEQLRCRTPTDSDTATDSSRDKRQISDGGGGGGSSSKRVRVCSPASSAPVQQDASPAPASSPPPCPPDDRPHSPHTPELKTEIQDMLEVKLEGGDSPEPCVSSASSSGGCNTTPAVTSSSSGSTSCITASSEREAATVSHLFILPKPNSSSDQHDNCTQQGTLKSTANLQPEFPLDPSCQNLPYPCPFCDKAYMSWGFRRRHIKGCHTSSPMLPCKWCFTLQPSHTHWETHVQEQHQLTVSAARNGLLILEEAHMVLQFAAPTRIHSLMELIKNKKTTATTTAATATTSSSGSGTTTTTAVTSPSTTTTTTTTTNTSSSCTYTTTSSNSSNSAVASSGRGADTGGRVSSVTTRRQKEEQARSGRQQQDGSQLN